MEREMERRPSQPPTVEELKLVYWCLEGGATNEEIFSALAQKRFHDPDHYFIRGDVRFMQARRREYQAAKEVLWARARQQVDPTFARALQEHFDLLTEIAKTLLSDGLDRLQVIYLPEEPEKPVYALISLHPETSIDETYYLPELKAQLKENLNLCIDTHGATEVGDYLTPHWAAEFRITGSLESTIDADPMAYIGNLKLFVARRFYAGKCPVCKDC